MRHSRLSPIPAAASGPKASNGSDAVGLVHDYLLVMRGAERTFAAIADCWPEAPVYTLLHDPKGINGAFENRAVHTSFLQHLHTRQSSFRRLLPLFPLAAKRLRLDQDLVISSTSAFAHGVSTRDDAVHVAYCYTPFRYAWHERDHAVAEAPAAMRPLVRGMLGRIRKWDREAADRVTHYIAISELSRKRIQDYYGRDARVVHPPVDVYRRFPRREPEEYFLVVTEVVPHKRVRNALEAARRAGRPIKVVGGGPELDDLRREYASSATFLGRVSDQQLDDLYSRARALVVPNVEEFGIAAVEAQAAGRPVLAADAGGARETVRNGETGVLVPPGDVDALAESMAATDWEGFDPERIREHALGFSEEAFQRRFLAEVARLTGRTLIWRKPEVKTRVPTLG